MTAEVVDSSSQSGALPMHEADAEKEVTRSDPPVLGDANNSEASMWASTWVPGVLRIPR